MVQAVISLVWQYSIRYCYCWSWAHLIPFPFMRCLQPCIIFICHSNLGKNLFHYYQARLKPLTICTLLVSLFDDCFLAFNYIYVSNWVAPLAHPYYTITFDAIFLNSLCSELHLFNAVGCIGRVERVWLMCLRQENFVIIPLFHGQHYLACHTHINIVSLHICELTFVQSPTCLREWVF